MRTTNITSVTIQKYPEHRVLPPDHPCVCNLSQIYIDKIHGNHKMSTNVKDPYSLTKSYSDACYVEPIADYLTNSTVDNKIVEDQFQNSILSVAKDEYTFGELLDLNYHEIPFLVEKLIPVGALVVLGGQSEIGKSTLYTQLAISIVCGDTEFFGCKIHPVHKRVLIISTEDGPPAFSFRILKQMQERRVDNEIRNSIVVKFNYDDLENRIREIVEHTPVDLIIIDAFGDVFGDGINLSNDVRRYLNNFSIINKRINCSTLFVHHVSKGKKKQPADKDQLLGSVGIEGKMRNVLMLSVVNSQHQLRIVKGNYVRPEDKAKPIYLKFDQKTLTFSVTAEPADQIGDPFEKKGNSIASGSSSRSKNRPGRRRDPGLFAEAIRMYNDKVPQVEIAKKVGREKSTICKWIKTYKNKVSFDFSQAGEVD